jgi:hypothetical protein
MSAESVRLEPSLSLTVDGAVVTLDSDTLVSILHTMLHHGMFTFSVNMPEDGDVVVTSDKKLTDWAWLEVGTRNAMCNEYEDGIQIELSLADALDGVLREKVTAKGGE